jgi:hypothetical protein
MVVLCSSVQQVPARLKDEPHQARFINGGKCWDLKFWIPYRVQTKQGIVVLQ